MPHQQELFVKMILLAWESQNSRTKKMIDGLSNDQLLSEVSPGRNRGIYLLGHLTSVNDNLFVILGIGQRLFPEYETIFVKNPDKSGIEMPDTSTLKNSWNQVTQHLTSRFNQFSVEEWFQRHTLVTEEDFAKEPHRNKLNVLMTRINHQAYHLGQLTFLEKK